MRPSVSGLGCQDQEHAQHFNQQPLLQPSHFQLNICSQEKCSSKYFQDERWRNRWRVVVVRLVCSGVDETEKNTWPGVVRETELWPYQDPRSNSITSTSRLRSPLWRDWHARAEYLHIVGYAGPDFFPVHILGAGPHQCVLTLINAPVPLQTPPIISTGLQRGEQGGNYLQNSLHTPS